MAHVVMSALQHVQFWIDFFHFQQGFPSLYKKVPLFDVISNCIIAESTTLAICLLAGPRTAAQCGDHSRTPIVCGVGQRVQEPSLGPECVLSQTEDVCVNSQRCCTSGHL